jgi:hypothetical protein
MRNSRRSCGTGEEMTVSTTYVVGVDDVGMLRNVATAAGSARVVNG